MNIKRDSIDMEAELFKLNPTVRVTDPNSPVTHGLNKREYFAAMAMQGYLVNNAKTAIKDEEIARWSVEAADALIAELNK
jgi:lactate dehydrogenase-like 2-hydroxyacid dehydrogenase